MLFEPAPRARRRPALRCRAARELWTVAPADLPVASLPPGERLDAEVVATLCAVKAAGGVIKGSADGLGTFGVVAGSAGGASRRPRAGRRWS